MISGKLFGFILWLAVSLVLIAVGIAAFFSKKEAGFFANTKPLPMKDVKGHNLAVGRLFIAYGIITMLLGIPILCGQNSLGILLSVLGLMLETIAAMAVYTLVIQPKYEKK